MDRTESLRVALLTPTTQACGNVTHMLAVGEALNDLGHEATILAVDEPGRRFARDFSCARAFIEVEPIVDESPYDCVTRRRDAIVRSLEEGPRRFDIHHASDAITASALAILFERRLIAGYIRTIHRLESHTDPRIAAIDDTSIRKARRVFVVSRSLESTIASRYAVTPHFVGNGVDRKRFMPSASDARSSHSLSFLSIGAIEERKNTIALLEAFAIVKNAHPHAHLTIAAGASVLERGAYLRAFVLRANELGLHSGEEYDVLGPIDDDELVTRMREASTFVVPSLVEGFGLVVLEAMACGTPVVVSNLAPFTDYLLGQDAIFVDPSDAVAIARGMLEACEMRTAVRLRERGPKTARRFAWSSVASACVRGYHG